MEDNRIEIRRGDNLFLKQVILHQGIPFSLTLNPSPARITVQSREELDAAIREIRPMRYRLQYTHAANNSF